ncbi:MAG: hypothetical protein HUJ97_09170 [Bacteroidales bacterium]|nr:hypothetical protein [Bacteroidales bacterium]
MNKTFIKRFAMVLVCMSLAIPSALAYVQCGFDCNGNFVHIFVPDGLTQDEQNSFIADAIDRICDQEVEAPDE